MQDAFNKHKISWMNCVGLSVDNTSVAENPAIALSLLLYIILLEKQAIALRM